MKEYLTKNSSGNYQLVNHRFSEDDIAVPEGAEAFTECMKHGELFQLWWKGECKICVGYDDDWFNIQRDTEDYLRDEKEAVIVWQRETLNDKVASAEVARQEEKHSHYKKDVSHLNVIDPYRIADLYDLHPCAEHIMKKSLCAGNRGHKDKLRDIQDIIDTAERWKQMLEEDSHEF